MKTFYEKRARFCARTLLLAFIIMAILFSSFGCKKQSSTAESEQLTIAVFIPGVMAGSPIYEMLAAGVQKAATEAGNAEVRIIEAGFNQADWETKLTSLAAEGTIDLIISSNPSLPALAESVSAKFPEQHFLLFDGEISGNERIYSLRYNQREQSYMAGYLAALVSLEGNNADSSAKRIGLIAGQEYPAMNDIMLPGYEAGAKAIDPAFEVDFRVVGNWYDAAKAADLAEDIIRQGAQVIFCVAGGANEGTVKTAENADAKVIWVDTNGYAISPGTVIGSTVLHQDTAAYEKTKLYLEGKLPFGKAEIVGVREGFVEFVQDDPLYISSVSEDVRAKQAAMIESIRSRKLVLKD
ncbi:MAG: BMP family ABC transporter substrate-binding protein [Treponema sp.]|jgi:simple sugar transport system substrate-binding protein|nr:BMP family ABC transporter substrate-binding protein [Treponema sp.]